LARVGNPLLRQRNKKLGEIAHANWFGSPGSHPGVLHEFARRKVQKRNGKRLSRSVKVLESFPAAAGLRLDEGIQVESGATTGVRHSNGNSLGKINSAAAFSNERDIGGPGGGAAHLVVRGSNQSGQMQVNLLH